MVGVLRQLGAPLKGTSMQGAMNNMQQRVYRPPNVAGWEGGMSWLNTNTVQGRFDLVTRVQYLKYSSAYSGHGQSAGRHPGRDRRAGVRPRLRVGQPAVALRAALAPACWPTPTAAPATTAALRRQRIYTLQSLMLGGPDGQVM